MGTSLLFMLVVWGLVTVALIVVATYRSVLAKDETDRLIVSQAESHLAVQQREVIGKVSRLDPFVKSLAWASGGLLVVCAVVWIWSSLSTL
jgi:Fe2+ transport system protein B